MDVTFGFMLRFDSYPPVAAVPPAQPPVMPARGSSHVIDAEIVGGVGAAGRNPSMNMNPDGSMGRPDQAVGRGAGGASARTAQFDMLFQQHQSSSPLTYSRQGGGMFASVGGSLLDTYA